METPSEAAAADGAALPPAGAKVPATLRDPGALRFWLAVVLTGVCAGIGAAALTLLFQVTQELAWGAADPAALFEAARQAAPLRKARRWHSTLEFSHPRQGRQLTRDLRRQGGSRFG